MPARFLPEQCSSIRYALYDLGSASHAAPGRAPARRGSASGTPTDLGSGPERSDATLGRTRRCGPTFAPRRRATVPTRILRGTVKGPWTPGGTRMTELSSTGDAGATRERRPNRIAAATLQCESCGKETPHRVIRWVRSGHGTTSFTSGVARCRLCRFTHRFDVARAKEVEIDEIVSDGPVSTRRSVRLPASAELRIGAEVPGSDPPCLIRRIDLRAGGSPERAVVNSVGAIWVAPLLPPSVPVSILEGPRTRPSRWSPRAEEAVGVGDEVEVDGVVSEIIYVRARGRTWRRSGDRFPTGEIDRLYVRRTVRPPPGRRAWSRVRGMPSSRANSASRRERSRSGPGVNTTRRAPRRRTASRGAIIQRVSPA